MWADLSLYYTICIIKIGMLEKFTVSVKDEQFDFSMQFMHPKGSAEIIKSVDPDQTKEQSDLFRSSLI